MGIKWSSPAGVAIIGGFFTVATALIGVFGSSVVDIKDSERVEPRKMKFSASRDNSGSIFEQSGELSVFAANSTKNDDFLLVGLRSGGVPSQDFFEVNVAQLLTNSALIESAELSFRRFKVGGAPESTMPLLLFLHDYGDLDVVDFVASSWPGPRLRTIESVKQLKEESIDLTEIIRDLIAGRQSKLRFHLTPASFGRVVEDRPARTIRIDPQDVRLNVRFIG